MNTNAWFVLVYASADEDSQYLLSTELQGLGRLAVQTEQANGEHFVIIGADEGIAAVAVHELVLTIDPHAELVETYDGSKPSSRRLEMAE